MSPHDGTLASFTTPAAVARPVEEESDEASFTVHAVELVAPEGRLEVARFADEARAATMASALAACLGDPAAAVCEQSEHEWSLLFVGIGVLSSLLALLAIAWAQPRSRIELHAVGPDLEDGEDAEVWVGRLGPPRRLWRGPSRELRVKARFERMGEENDIWCIEVHVPGRPAILLARSAEKDCVRRAEALRRFVENPPGSA